MPECETINCICFEIQLKQPGGASSSGGIAEDVSGQQAYPGGNIAYGQNPRPQPQIPHVNPGYA